MRGVMLPTQNVRVRQNGSEREGERKREKSCCFKGGWRVGPSGVDLSSKALLLTARTIACKTVCVYNGIPQIQC